MRVSSMTSAFLLLLASSIAGVQSHGYLKSPRSRNFIASQEGVWSGGTSDSYPMETCPHCLNRGGTAGQCGIVGDRSYDDNLNILGQPMAPSPQAQYSQGDEIEVDVVLTAHHLGHFEFFACPIETGGIAAGDCFAQYPLAFVSDPLYGAPKDAMYPNRAYIAPPGRATTSNNGTPETHYLFRLKLPDNLAGDLVLLQWHYFTANSCTYPGYDTYAFPADWGNMHSGTEICQTISPDGNGAPEQFWNCAEISVFTGPTLPTTSSPVGAHVVDLTTTPVDSPSVVTTTVPVAAPSIIPTITPVAAPVSTPTVNPVLSTNPTTAKNSCGDGAVGNGVCSIPGLCCSKWGYCGEGEAYCDETTTSIPAAPISTPAAPASSGINETQPPATTLSNTFCGDGAVANGRCSNPALCCSKWGFCGEGASYCEAKSVSAPFSPQSFAPVAVSEPSAVISPLSTPTAAAPVESPTSSLVTPIPFPDYADADCSGVENVMAVNLGYYQSWAIYRQPGCNPVVPSHIDVAGNKYTHLTYTFASINEQFELEPWDGGFDAEVPQYRAFNDLKQLYPELRTQIAVGGWTFNDPGSTQTRFSETARTAANRGSFAASCVTFCREYGFDGVDLDWEYPVDASRGGDASDKVNFVLLVEEIRAAFDAAPEDLTLSMAVPAADWRLKAGYDLSALAEGLDFFNVMTYDIHGVWDNPQIVGANTDMQSIFDSVQYFLENGVQASKLVLGLAAYGHTYTLTDPSCATVGCPFSSAGPGGCAGAPGFMPYFSINKYVKSGDYDSLEFNSDSGTMELVVNTNELISFDNPATMQLKYDFAAKACMRGLMWWAVDMKEEAIVLGPR